MQNVLLVLLCYIVGSIPFSYIFSRLLGGVDIRSQGTGNVGATNVLRTLGLKIAVASLVGDVLKGAVSAWLGFFLGGPALAAICVTAAVAGHCWPVFLGFRGGKGVATWGGALLTLMPLIGLIGAANLVIIIAASGFVSLGSVCTVAILPLIIFLMHYPWQYTVMSLVVAIIIIFRHRTNLERLHNGTERKINEKSV